MNYGNNFPKLWILKSKGEQSAFGGNSGYADRPESEYVFDNNVKNHDKIKTGDFIVIADKKNIIGISIIDTIESTPGVPRIRYRCPICNIQEHYSRQSILPRYKCRNKHEFDRPVEENIIVEEFTAKYGRRFIRAKANTSVRILDDYYIKRNLYYSIQAGDITLLQNEFPNELENLNTEGSLAVNEATTPPYLPPYIPGNEDQRDFSTAKRPTRKGQHKFRGDLIKNYGLNCMLTECTVSEAIEAGHINPYRGDDDNHPENGLLLRKDIHALFDKDLIGIEPLSKSIQLHPSLEGSHYSDLNGKRLILSNNSPYKPSLLALNIRWEQFVRGLMIIPDKNIQY